MFGRGVYCFVPREAAVDFPLSVLGPMYIKPPTDDEAAASRWAVRLGTKAALAGAMMFACGLLLQRTSAESTAVSIAGKVLEYVGFRFLVVAILYGIAGGVARFIPDFEQRKSLVIVVLLVACVGFLFVPICWNPKNDDCRSIASRLSDAIAARFRSSADARDLTAAPRQASARR